MQLDGEAVARWLAAGDADQKLTLLVGGTFDDEREDASWEITGEAAPAGFQARMIPSGRLRVFRFADLSGLPIELAATPELRSTLRAALTEAVPPEVKTGREVLRRAGYDPDRLDEPALIRLGRFVTDVSGGRLPDEGRCISVYNLLKDASMFRVGAKLLADAFRLDPKSILLRIQAATLARHNSDFEGALALTEPATRGSVPGASRLQMIMLLTIRGHALVSTGQIVEAERCAKRAYAMAEGADHDGYIAALFRAIKAAAKPGH